MVHMIIWKNVQVSDWHTDKIERVKVQSLVNVCEVLWKGRFLTFQCERRAGDEKKGIPQRGRVVMVVYLFLFCSVYAAVIAADCIERMHTSVLGLLCALCVASYLHCFLKANSNENVRVVFCCEKGADLFPVVKTGQPFCSPPPQKWRSVRMHLARLVSLGDWDAPIRCLDLDQT